MYTRISRSGGRAYLQLVESYRNDKGAPRQRVVANLGRLDRLSEADLKPLIGGLRRALGQPDGSNLTPEFTSAKAYGDLYALQSIWDDLGLSRALRRALRSSRHRFDVEALVRAMVFNRLSDPYSKLGVLRWLETVAMPDIPEQVSHDQLLRTMDALMDHAPAIEKTISGLLRPLVDDTLSVVFYDLTTVRIHGEGHVADDLRAYGQNKRTGGIARQFALGVVQTAEGLPIAHQVHVGNTSEQKTLIPMIDTVIKQFPIKRVVVIADRGLLSLDNLEAVESLKTAEDEPLEYVLGVPGRRYRDFAELMTNTPLNDGLGETQWQGRRLVIAHDDERAARQGEARRKKIEELEAEGDRLATRLDKAAAGQALRGRKSTDRRAYTRFVQLVKDAGLSRILKADLEADLFTFSRDDAVLHDMEQLDGKLLLVTNTDFAASEVVTRYKSLADIERGFCVLKNDIAIGPVYHRLAERIRAHSLIYFLALVLYRIMRMRLKANGSTVSPRQALSLLRQIQQHRVSIGNQTFHGISKLVPTQRDLFKELDLSAPTAKRTM